MWCVWPNGVPENQWDWKMISFSGRLIFRGELLVLGSVDI